MRDKHESGKRPMLMQYMLIYLMIIMHGAVIWSAFVEDSYPGILGVAVLVICTIFVFRIRVPLYFYLFSLVTLGCYLLSALINGIGFSNGLNIKTALIVDLNMLMIITIYNMDKTNAVRRFVRTVLFFACISLVFYFISLAFGTGVFGGLFHPIQWGRGHSGCLIYSYTAETRNYGIFYEPGVYQVLLTSALYCFVYFGQRTGFKKKGQTTAVVILILTIITSGSTTGYISAFIIICGVLLKRKTKRDKQILAFIILSVAVLITEYYINGKNSLIQMHLINKLTDVSKSDLDSSGGARLFIIRQTFEAMKIDPFFGVGAKILQTSINEKYYSGFGTGNVLFSMILTKGLVTTGITLGVIFRRALKNSDSFSQFLVYVCIFLNTVMAQTQIAYPAFLLLAVIEPLAHHHDIITDEESSVNYQRFVGVIKCKQSKSRLTPPSKPTTYEAVYPRS
jgi:hypothetical protein